MQLSSFSLFVLPYLLIYVASASAADSGPEGAMEEFLTAFNKSDAAGVAAVFHDDGRLLPAGERVVTGAQDTQAYWQGAFDAGLSHIDKSPIEIVVSDDLAVEINSCVVTFNDAKIAGKDTLVSRKDADNKWTIFTDIWNDDH